MTEHTPGSWTAEKCNDAQTWYVHNDTEVLAHVGTGLGMTRAMIAANAHLIAAAPELLEACEAMVAVKSFGDYTTADEMARAAIAKAKFHPSGA